MHPKASYNICICSVILGRTWAFSKLQGIQYDFPENFRCNLSFNESENFSDSSFHDILFLNPKILGFFFLRKIALPGEWNMKN